MPDTLLTDAEARDLIECAKGKVWEWIEEGALWAINIASEEATRPCYRISRVSALQMRQACRTGAGFRQRRAAVRKSLDT